MIEVKLFVVSWKIYKFLGKDYDEFMEIVISMDI